MLHRLVRLNKRQPLPTVRQILRVHPRKVDRRVQNQIGHELPQQTRRVRLLLELLNTDHDEVTHCRHRTCGHAPLQWQGQHRIWHEDDEEDVPNEILSIRISQSGANKSLQVEQEPRASGSPMKIVVGKAPPQAQEADHDVCRTTTDRPSDTLRGNGPLLPRLNANHPDEGENEFQEEID